MKEFIQKHAKAYMIIGICILIGSLGITYAYYNASVTNDSIVVGQAGGGTEPLMTISLVSTEATDNLVPIQMTTNTLSAAANANPKCVDRRGYSACQIYSVTVKNNSDINQSYNINLSSLYGATTPNVEAVSMGTSSTEVTNINSIKNNGLICTTNSVGKGKTTTACYFMVFIKNLDVAQTDSGTFTGSVTATSTTGSEIKADFGEKKPTLIDHITNLYSEASKTTVTNNGINYNYASSVRLMNDRQGTNDVAADGGNIRYYGADDSNLKNYIYFNCSDYSNQSSETCEVWRIIGIVDGKVKLIRSSSIGGYAWDDDLNDWNTSTLKDILNSGEYYSSLQTKNSKTIELIADTTWYINGMSDSDIYVNTSYIGERTGDSTWPGKIALAYPSDYGYSVDLNSCSNTLYYYEDESCTSVNWLTSMFTLDYYYWLLTPDSDNSDDAWLVGDGFVNDGYGYDVSGEDGVLPVLYLNSELSFESEGDGSRDNPYRISVS